MENYVQQRTTGYYYRQRVPKLLQEAVGKSEIVVSLHTQCQDTAAYRSAYLRLAVSEYLNTQGPMHRHDLTHEHAAQIADRWKRKALNQDFDQRLSGQARPERPEEIHAKLNHTLNDLHRLNLEPYGAMVQQVMSEHRLDVESDGQRRLGYYLLKAQAEFLEEIQKRSDPARPHPMAYIPPDESEAAIPQNWLRLSEAVDRWASEDGRRELTIKEWRYRVQRFIELKGDPYVHEITVDDIHDFVEAYEQLPNRMPKSDRSRPLPEIIERYRGLKVERLAPQSVTNAVTSVSSVLNWCVEHRILKENVARGVRVAKRKQAHERRLPFKPEDLRAIFEDSPVFARGYRPRGGAGHAAYWIPVLALYSGARLEEIAQLALSDIRVEGDITFMEIEDIAEGQSVKNAASRRRVPLHARVMALGFMAYVNEMRERGHTDLFQFVQSQTGKRSSPYSKWVNRYFRKICKIRDRRLVFHSFRHTFSDASREAEIPRELRNALMGHTINGVDEEYGMGYSLRVLNDAMQKVSYHQLEIPRWQAFPARTTTPPSR